MDRPLLQEPMLPEAPSSILERLAPHFDLVLNIAEILSSSKAFATLANLSVVSRNYHDTLGPFMRSLKKKIVLDIEDLRWLPKERYTDIH